MRRRAAMTAPLLAVLPAPALGRMRRAGRPDGWRTCPGRALDLRVTSLDVKAL